MYAFVKFNFRECLIFTGYVILSFFYFARSISALQSDISDREVTKTL